MRLILVLLIGLTLIGSGHAAEVSQSWKDGVWDEKRMEKLDGMYLIVIGERYLRGKEVEQNIFLAEFIFETAARKDPAVMSMIGSFYVDQPTTRTKALEWFVRSKNAGNKDFKFWLGIALQITGFDIKKRRIPVDPQNTKALAWFLAASKYGNKTAKRQVVILKQYVSAEIMKHVEERSNGILLDPVTHYLIMRGLKIAPAQL